MGSRRGVLESAVAASDCASGFPSVDYAYRDCEDGYCQHDAQDRSQQTDIRGIAADGGNEVKFLG